MNTPVRTVAQFVLAFLTTIGAIAPAQNPQPDPAQKISTASTTLVVLADHHIQDHLWPILVATLIRDAAAQSELASVNGNLKIILSGINTPGPIFPSRIEVELIGRCDLAWDHNASLRYGPLGWVLGKPGQIAPIIYVDCAEIGQIIYPSTRNMTENQRLRATSEAVSHVILHEWIHIATQSPAHAAHGIMQPALTAPELVTPAPANGKLALQSCLSASRPQCPFTKPAQPHQPIANPQWLMANPYSLVPQDRSGQ
jgi:hypothetical protein